MIAKQSRTDGSSSGRKAIGRTIAFNVGPTKRVRRRWTISVGFPIPIVAAFYSLFLWTLGNNGVPFYRRTSNYRTIKHNRRLIHLTRRRNDRKPVTPDHIPVVSEPRLKITRARFAVLYNIPVETKYNAPSTGGGAAGLATKIFDQKPAACVAGTSGWRWCRRYDA